MVLLIAALTGCGSEASVRKEDKMMLPENAKAMENAVGQGFTPRKVPILTRRAILWTRREIPLIKKANGRFPRAAA